MSFYELDEKSNTISQPDGIHVKLRPHQLTSIAAMIELENKPSIIIDRPGFKDGFDYLRYRSDDYFDDSTLIIETNIAFLADKVGSGKTYMILGLISTAKNPSQSNGFIEGSKHFSIRMIRNKVCNNVSLIVVPHGLVNQWTGFLDCTDIKYVRFTKEADFNIFFGDKGLSKKFKNVNSDKVETVMKQNQVFLLNINRYKTFHEIFPSEIWARLIIDEIDTIALPRIFNETGNFSWFVSATPENYSRSYRYLNNILENHSRNMIRFLSVRNNDDYVNKSITLPNPNIFFIETMLQRVVSVFSDMLPSEVVTMINAGNMEEAIKKLNCNVSTSNNIITILTENIKKELFNLEKKLIYVKSIVPQDPTRIKKISDKISSNNTKLKTIKDRINSIKNEICIICADSYNKPAVVHCCKNVYCLECLMGSLAACHNQCPMCRSKVTKKDYTVIDEGKVASKKIIPKDDFGSMDKSKVLEIILKHLKNKYVAPKILIFSDYHQTFDNIKNNITDSGLKFAKIAGVPAHITNVINKFNVGEINVLLLDSSHYGSGLNLQAAEFVILYHRMNDAVETQVIGRAHRFGRTTSLNVIYLVDNNEDKKSPFTCKAKNICSPDDFSFFGDIVKQSNVVELIKEDPLSDSEESSESDKRDFSSDSSEDSIDYSPVRRPIKKRPIKRRSIKRKLIKRDLPSDSSEDSIESSPIRKPIKKTTRK